VAWRPLFLWSSWALERGERDEERLIPMILMYAKYSWATRSQSCIRVAVMPRALGCRLSSTHSAWVVLYSCPAISWSLFRGFPSSPRSSLFLLCLVICRLLSLGVDRLRCPSFDFGRPRCAPWTLSHIIWSCKHVMSAKCSIAAPHRCAAACYMLNVELIWRCFKKFSPRKAKTIAKFSLVIQRVQKTALNTWAG
jgi:hypothetical protein